MIIKRTNKIMMLSSMGVLVVAALIGVGATLSRGTSASGGTTPFTTLATHPQAAAQSTAKGKEIADLMVQGTTLYAGYGDYNANTGPIAINPFNLNTNAFTGSVLSVPNEENMVLRKINGNTYVPMVDPQVPWTQPAGYATNASGTWVNENKIPNIVHAFDMTVAQNGDLWLVGSAVQSDGVTEVGATAYRSTDNGATWNLVQTDQSTPQSAINGYERYYWVASLNGKIYMQAESVTPAAPVRIFDGTSWTTGTTNRVCGASRPNRVEVFAGYIVCMTDTQGIRLFDGTTVSDLTIDSDILGSNLYDMYVADDGYLYALGSSGIARTSDGQTWRHVTNLPNATARSIAIYNDHIYLGTTTSQILRSTLAISNIQPLTPEITSISPSLVGTNTPTNVWVNGKDFSVSATVTVGGIPAQVLARTAQGIQIAVPERAAPGPVDVVVTNSNGQSATAANGITYGSPVVTQAQFGTDSSKRKTLTVGGQYFIGPDLDWNTGFSNSLVSLNGQALPFCTEDTSFTSAQFESFGFDPQYFSDSAPCYYLFSSNDGVTTTPLIKADQVTILLPDNFDTTARGTVQVNSAARGRSAVFQFNVPKPPVDEPTVGAPNTSIDPTPAQLTLKAALYFLVGFAALALGALGTKAFLRSRAK